MMVSWTALVALAVQLDVGWVPTPVEAAVAALRWAGVGPEDSFFELGCGDGRVAAQALQLGANVVCIERDPVLAAQAAELLSAAASTPLLSLAASTQLQFKVIEEDVFSVDLSNATIIFLFMLPEINARLRHSIPPGITVLSRNFEMTGWPCGERLKLPGFSEPFLKWTSPSLGEESKSDDYPDDDPVQHLLECAAQDAVGEDEEALQHAAVEAAGVEHSDGRPQACVEPPRTPQRTRRIITDIT